ncbi:CLUMA_CG006578, isoform A [Clunio marinus]|uniref:CLUMA_CG006578, isoform A n=1 Tax=Clunio marinus TaxID=568069 RepID=A0A1J1HYR6_9DIPT|nr:CLUMA_CG006578, isoform A [Clunio marinus]
MYSLLVSRKFSVCCGVAHTTAESNGSSEIFEVNQSFIWPLARPATPEETILIELRQQNTKLPFKAGSSSSSGSSRGTISSASKVIGQYVMLMQGLMQDGRVNIEDNLVDSNNRPISAVVNFEIRYASPENVAGNFDSPTVSKFVQQQSLEDDQQMLLNIEQNIANLEKSFQDAELKKQNIFQRALGGERNHQMSNNNGNNKVKKSQNSDVTGSASVSDKRVTLRAVKNFMRIGRSRHSSKERERDSSTEDEGRSLIGDADESSYMGRKDSTVQYDNMSHAESVQSMMSSDIDNEIENDENTENDANKADQSLQETQRSQDGRTKVRLHKFNDHLKSQDFQVCVTIIEARQLPGLNMDPVVCIQVGDQKKYTSVKESTNCPYYNEYFVFDFHMPPVMLFDKIITLSVIHSRRFMRSGQTVGSFKIDLKTVYDAHDHLFYHKWALLSDPDDFLSGPKGYLKCDVGIIGKGDTVKVPPRSEKDPDDIEANLLLPDGVPIERQRAKFVIKIYRADGLPRMNSSLVANVKRAFTGETRDLVNPYVQVSFAGLMGKSTVKKASYAPVWNEELIFTEMFPPLCQRIKIQLRDADPMKPAIIGTHYIDLKQISNDGEKGFLPTYGPSFIHLYGSTRDYSLLDSNSTLNTGLGEGVSYRARLLVAIRTEITDNADISTDKNVELEQTYPISESSYCKNEEFFLFATIFEASMLDKKTSEKSVHFELSIGNWGNALDGHNESNTHQYDDDDELVPFWDYKPSMNVRCIFPDQRRRMYNSNMLSRLTEKMEIGLSETNHFIEQEDPKAEVRLRSCLEELATDCSNYLQITKNTLTGPGTGKTKLDKERIKLCQREIETIGNMARNLRALVTRSSLKERFKTAQTYLQKLRFLIEDPQHALPDVFIWLIANGKRIAYHRMNARDLIYSTTDEETGAQCGKVQTVFFKLPGKQAAGPAGWKIRAKLTLYVWLGIVKHKKFFFSGLPRGFELSQDLRNAERPRALAPTNIHYLEKHTFQLRAHIYQARSLIGSDASGLSDPYATVFISEFSKTTQVIEETLSPTWDELLVFDDVLVYGAKEEIQRDPPTVVIEIYDQDKVGKSEFIGRAIAKPKVKLKENPYKTPILEWFEIIRGNDSAGELLAAFEMLEIGSNDLPALTEPKYIPVDVKGANSQHPIIFPVPRDVRPHLARFRIEVLFWGLRDLKRVHFMSVDKPRIDVECSGNILSSSIIQNAKKNPNFANMLKFFDLELPVEETYAPPITIRCVDCRSFGRYTLVGTHQITSIHKYMHRPAPRESVSKQNGHIILSSDKTITNEEQQQQQQLLITTDGTRLQRTSSSCENLTLYGAACVGKVMKKSTSKKKHLQQMSDDSMEQEDDDDETKDWWTKYFLSYEKLIESTKGSSQRAYESLCISPVNDGEHQKRRFTLISKSKIVQKISPKHVAKTQTKVKNFATCEIFPHELEAQSEYNYFKEWLLSFPLYRGKKTGDSMEDENRIVGYFKGSIKVYRLPVDKTMEPAFAPSLPLNDPIHVLVRVYIVKATDLHPMDLNGKADPYVVLQLGGKKISDKDNYVSKQLNPVFGKCFEIECCFPQDSMLTVQIFDWDLVGSDDLIGETKIDLENRFYSKHRALCGLSKKYEDTGYNAWRDPMKPTQILLKLCKDNKLENPHYFQDRVVIGRYCMTFGKDEVIAWNSPTTCKYRDEHLALAVLHRWEEIPRVGCKIVPEHIESRPIYNPEKPGIEQGKLEMWVDLFPMDMPLPGPPVDISPRKPKSYELRVVIWNTDDVVLEDDAFFSGEKMSDIYVKGWLKGPQDVQSTDIHYRSLTGEGNFNWRFIFPFEYLAAEERIVLSRKESLFSWDETEVKIPARLELQVWDADHFSADDFLGAISLNLTRFPRGAKNSKLCSLDMLKSDVPTVNIFKQKRVRGWWPFFIKKENDEMELTGKVEAEIHLLSKEEAEKNQAGFGRNEPDALEKPNRPDASFMWFLNPLKSIRYIIWHNYKWKIIKALIFLCIAFMILLFFYSIPGYTVKKLIGA